MAIAAKRVSDEREIEKEVFKWVGTRATRPDGVDKVTGRAKFGADLHLPNMLVGKVLRSPHAHARILSIATSDKPSLLKGSFNFSSSSSNIFISRSNSKLFFI